MGLSFDRLLDQAVVAGVGRATSRDSSLVPLPLSASSPPGANFQLQGATTSSDPITSRAAVNPRSETDRHRSRTGIQAPGKTCATGRFGLPGCHQIPIPRKQDKGLNLQKAWMMVIGWPCTSGVEMRRISTNYTGARVLEHVTLKLILVAAVLLWLLPAVGYWIMSNHYSAVGSIAYQNGIAYAPADALYFSIVTEAALGDGNLTAHGGARWLAAGQVVLAILLTGMGIAKLTTLEARLSHKAAGDWIEIFWTADHRPMVSFSSIYHFGRSLRYDGENFSADGNPQGTFVGELADESPMTATFTYSNRASNTKIFVEGKTHHLFWSDTDSGMWNRFQSTCHDVEKDAVEIQGFRASDSEIQVIRGRDSTKLRRLVRQYVKVLGDPPGLNKAT